MSLAVGCVSPMLATYRCSTLFGAAMRGCVPSPRWNRVPFACLSTCIGAPSRVPPSRVEADISSVHVTDLHRVQDAVIDAHSSVSPVVLSDNLPFGWVLSPPSPSSFGMSSCQHYPVRHCVRSCDCCGERKQRVDHLPHSSDCLDRPLCMLGLWIIISSLCGSMVHRPHPSPSSVRWKCSSTTVNRTLSRIRTVSSIRTTESLSGGQK